MEVTPPPSNPSRLPQRPIWSPDPAVPLIARILAYVFAALMLFTVIHSNTHVRPLDNLLYPQRWRNYTGALCTVTYPSGWRVIDQSERSLSHVYFVYSTAGPSYIETMVRQSGELITPETMEQLLETKLAGYQPREATNDDDALAGWHFFRASAAEPNAAPVVGAWLLRTQEDRTLFLLAMSPADNWSTMADISSTMLQQIAL